LTMNISLNGCECKNYVEKRSRFFFDRRCSLDEIKTLIIKISVRDI